MPIGKGNTTGWFAKKKVGKSMLLGSPGGSSFTTGIFAPKFSVCQYCNNECPNPGKIDITGVGDTEPCFEGCLNCLVEAVKLWKPDTDTVTCVCTTMQLHAGGCICGAFKKEQENAKVQKGN